MRRVVVIVIVLSGMACSDRSPVGPDHGRLPCRPSLALVARVSLDPLAPFAPFTMRDALQHAADRMLGEVGESAHRRDLRDAMLGAVVEIGEGDFGSACRLVTIADEALHALPDSAASFADRDGIQIILALTAHSLNAVIGQ